MQMYNNLEIQNTGDFGPSSEKFEYVRDKLLVFFLWLLIKKP